MVLALIRRSLVPKASLVLSPQQSTSSSTQTNSNATNASASKLSSAPCGLRVLEQSLAAVARGNSKSLSSFLRADNAPDLLLRLSAAARSHPTLHGQRRLAAVVRAVFHAAVTAKDDSSERSNSGPVALEASNGNNEGSSEGTPLSASQSQGGGTGSSNVWEQDEAVCRVLLHAAVNMLDATNTTCGGASTVGAWPLPLGDVALDLLSGVVEHALQNATTSVGSPGSNSSISNSGGAAAAFLGTHLLFLSEVLLQCLLRLHAAAKHQRLIRQAYRQRAAACGAGLCEDSLGHWSSIGATTSSTGSCFTYFIDVHIIFGTDWILIRRVNSSYP